MSRNTNQKEDKKDSKRSINRRRLIKTMGVVGGATALGSTAIDTAAAKHGEVKEVKKNITVESLSAPRNEGVIQRAINDPAVKKIKSKFNREGWVLSQDDLNALKSTQENKKNSPDSTYYTVILPFKRPRENGNEETYITWSSYGDLEPRGYNVHQKSDVQTEETESKVEFTSYWVENGELKSHNGTDSLDPDINHGSVSAKLLCTAMYTCTGNLNTACIAGAAAGVVGGSESCKACYVDVTRISCIACAAVLIGAGITISQCCQHGHWDCIFCC
ncbi:twin-arginine translocation signal domain-containing protein [Haladaptatus sp. R4]|uniref:twin-arginine translocation signal domain-containing protein n=1 Tax=Haladaptatus sp. R4 TaxID=1679489 RepID=UPI000AA8FAF3|nr:twin-arginine translocation signal domain-containing protein [Haladaptatus sp. R4]